MNEIDSSQFATASRPADDSDTLAGPAIKPGIDTFDLSVFLPFLLNRAGTSVAGAMSETLKNHGLTITSWRLLASLHQHDSLRIGELADFACIELWTVSRAVSRLESDGLVARQRIGEDARTVNASLTDTGRTLIEQLIPQARGHEMRALQDFTPAEAENLQQMLQKIYRNID